MSLYFSTPQNATKRELFPGVTAQVDCCKTMTVSVVTMQPESVVPLHRHPHEQAGTVVSGSALFEIGGESMVLTAGDMYRIPGGTLHRVTAQADGLVAIDVFHPVREEYC